MKPSRPVWVRQAIGSSHIGNPWRFLELQACTKMHKDGVSVKEREKMKRLGILVLAASAALVLTVGAGTASASRFRPETVLSTIHGSSVYGWELEPSWLKIGCYSSTFTAEASNFPENLYTSNDQGECLGAYPLKMNGCHFLLRPGEEISSGYFGGTFDIGPPNCGPITISEPPGSCTLKIYPKEGFEAHYRNIGSGSTAEVEFIPNGTGVKVEGIGGGTICGGAGKTDEKAKLKGYFSINATSGGIQKGVYVENGTPPSPALSVGAGTSFETASYVSTVRGAQLKEVGFKTPAGSAVCGTIQGGEWLLVPGANLEMPMELGNCAAFGLGAVSHTNGCNFKFTVSNAEAPYVGSLSLVCPTGKSLEFEVLSNGVKLCKESIPGQELATLALENVGSGAGSYVVASVSNSNAVKYKYTISGPSVSACGSLGTYSDGYLKNNGGSFKLTQER
jgi:hypothetical protein